MLHSPRNFRHALLSLALLALGPAARAQRARPGASSIGPAGTAPPTHRIDFEDFAPGTVLAEVDTPEGSVAVHGANPDLPGQNAAVVFDSTVPTGGDVDLGTPHVDFGGAGIGAGGAAGSPFANDRARGHLLVSAEDLDDADLDGLVDDPSDTKTPGSVLTFDFRAVGPVEVLGLVAMDIEGYELHIELKAFDAAGTELAQVLIPPTGDNGVAGWRGSIVGVERLEVRLNGSGAIDDLCFRRFVDCNENGIQDHLDIRNGISRDEDGSGVPDECEFRTLGIAVGGPKETYVFDADRDEVLAYLSMPYAVSSCTDVEILDDLSLGFIAIPDYGIWVVDLTASPPRLASGVNPISTRARGFDTAVTEDQRYLLSTSGPFLDEGVSVVDIQSRTELGFYSYGTGTDPVEAGPGGVVFIDSYDEESFYELHIDADGNLFPTGRVVPTASTQADFLIDPSGRYLVAVLFQDLLMKSYDLQTLQLLDTQVLRRPPRNDIFTDGVFSPTGEDVYVLGGDGPAETMLLQRFGFDLATGRIADKPVWSRVYYGNRGCTGGERLAVHPNGEKLYLASLEFSEVRILRTDNGDRCGTLPGADFIGSIGIVRAPVP